jgi:hypothetical protein
MITREAISVATTDRRDDAKFTTILPNDRVGESNDKLASDLIDHLRETFTPAEVLQQFEPFLRENHNAKAEPLYRLMVAAEMEGRLNIGTLRKAGKWIWGVTFEPAPSGETLTPSGELERLRQENAQLHARVATLTAEKLSLSNQSRCDRERAEKAEAEVLESRLRNGAFAR